MQHLFKLLKTNVSSLPSDRPDQELAAIVHEAFVGFGFNVVKVRRDKHQNPFALVQFDVSTFTELLDTYVI